MRMRKGLVVAVSAFALSGLLSACGESETQRQTGPAAPAAAPSQTAKETKPAAPLVPTVQVTDWCKEHTVPESVCTRCNEALIPDFKKKGDWCNEHSLPESQCIECHPDLKAKFEAMAPKA